MPRRGRDEQGKGRGQEWFGEVLCVAMRNTVTVEKPNLKFEARDKERTEKDVQDAPNWWDKNQLAENDGEMSEVVNLTPREWVRNRTKELNVASPVSRIQEVIVGVLKDTLQERVQQLMQRQVPAV